MLRQRCLPRVLRGRALGSAPLPGLLLLLLWGCAMQWARLPQDNPGPGAAEPALQPEWVAQKGKGPELHPGPSGTPCCRKSSSISTEF